MAEVIVELTDEEKEAEQFLDRMEWDSSNESASIYMHKSLASEASALNIEIIDFLLQWEDEDDRESDFLGSKSSALGDGKQTQDTADVLLALRKIDYELGEIEEWLGTQIDTLSSVQAEIQKIEAENNTLESSWQNLTNLKSVTNTIITTLLSPTEEDVLKKP